MSTTTRAVIVALSLALALTGCGEPEPAAQPRGFVEQSTTDSAAKDAPADAQSAEEAPTGPGELCDIESLDTVECHKQYPETAYLNAITRNSVEPLASMADSEKIALGHEACEMLSAGTARDSIALVEDADPDAAVPNRNNKAIVGGAVPSFCPELDDSGLFD